MPPGYVSLGYFECGQKPRTVTLPNGLHVYVPVRGDIVGIQVYAVAQTVEPNILPRQHPSPRQTRISLDVDALLEQLRSPATSAIVDELYVEIEDFGKMEYDGGYHEGYDRGCEDTEDGKRED